MFDWASGKRPANIHWDGVDRATVGQNLGPNEAVLVNTTATILDGVCKTASTESDPIGFLLIEGGEGRGTTLRFSAIVGCMGLGRAITAFTILALLFVRRPRIWIAAGVIPAGVCIRGFDGLGSFNRSQWLKTRSEICSRRSSIPGGIVRRWRRGRAVRADRAGGVFDRQRAQT